MFKKQEKQMEEMRKQIENARAEANAFVVEREKDADFVGLLLTHLLAQGIVFSQMGQKVESGSKVSNLIDISVLLHQEYDSSKSIDELRDFVLEHLNKVDTNIQ